MVVIEFTDQQWMYLWGLHYVLQHVMALYISAERLTFENKHSESEIHQFRKKTK